MTVMMFYLAYAALLATALSRAGLRSAAAISNDAPARPVERVLIVGATGGTGRELVRQALERGHEVTALARNPSRLAVPHPRLRVVEGDVLDYATVERAVRDQDAVISALGTKRFWFPKRVLSEGTRNVLRAMEAHGVRRLVCETSLGIGDSAGRMGLYYTLFVVPVVLPVYFWDKTRQERLIAASDAEWVIVRPGALTNARGRGAYRDGRGVGSFLWTVRIARADVAHFMLEQATRPSHLKTAVGVCW